MNMAPPPHVRFFLLRYLDDWRTWVTMIVAALIAVNVWTLTIYRTQARDEAARGAEIVANADGQYHQCVRSIPILRKFNSFIVGEQIVHDALVRNSVAVLAGTTKADPQYKIRVDNLARLRRARRAAYAVKLPVPTKKTCAALHARLLRR